MSRIEVIYTASRNLYNYLMASVMSLLEYNPTAHVWMFIEDNELPYEVPPNVEVVNVSGQTIFNPTCANWRTNYTYMSLLRSAYTKLFTGEPNDCGVRPLPKLDKILQLDVDTIVQDTLEPVWNTDLSGKWFAAVPDYPANNRPWGRNRYFNAGVCLFSLEQIRQDHADDAVIDLINRQQMVFIDEMAWNKANNDAGDTKAVDLDPRYNQTSEVAQTFEPAVMHYAGFKRWWQDFGKMQRPYYIMKYSKYFHGFSGEMKDVRVLNYALRSSGFGRVRFMLDNDRWPVLSEMTYHEALKWLLRPGVHMSDKFHDFPITADDKYFFEGVGEWKDVQIPAELG